MKYSGVDPNLRPIGLGLSLAGNFLFAIAFGRGLALVNELSVDPRLGVSDAGRIAGPLTMLAVGYLMIRLAPRFGGGSFGVQFLVIGVTSLMGAMHATNGVDRFVGFTIGGIFLTISLVGLLAAGLTSGWKHALTHAGPVVLVGGRQVDVGGSRGALELAKTLNEVERLQASGQLTDAQVEAIRQWSGAVNFPRESL